MLEAEDIGLYKFDILSQRGLGKIKDTLTLVKKNQGDDIDIHDIDRLKKTRTLNRYCVLAIQLAVFTWNHPPCACCWPNFKPTIICVWWQPVPSFAQVYPKAV
jgi:hypothetical protein